MQAVVETIRSTHQAPLPVGYAARHSAEAPPHRTKERAPLTEDKALVVRIQRGDERAFRELYRTYSPMLLRRLVRWVGDTQQAEDCLQQVFLEALRSIENFRGEGKLGSWLNRIATHVVMDMFRQKQRMKALMERVLPQQEAGMLDQPPALPEQLFLREETRLWVRELLEKLSPQKRMAVLLCDLEGMSLEDASQQMGVPTGTVGSRLYHARRELQKRVESELQKRGLGWEDLA